MASLQVLKRPITTEKSTHLTSTGKFVFAVDHQATKNQIKQAVETIFSVRVIQVNTLIMPGKTRRIGRRQISTPAWKKAIVCLKPGDKINLFDLKTK